jgi:hypothetical protein
LKQQLFWERKTLLERRIGVLSSQA